MIERRLPTIIFLVAIFSFEISSDDSDLLAAECSSAAPEISCFDPNASLLKALMPKQTLVSFRKSKREKSFPVRLVRGHRGVRPSTITFFNIHSREAFVVVDGSQPKQLVLNELFQCRGFGKKKALDPRLMETMLNAATYFEAKRVEIVSAYRSPKFNDALSKKARNVASESRHTRGQAVDFRLDGIPARELGEWLWTNFEGGIGVYSVNGFVHIDVGPKRRWNGR